MIQEVYFRGETYGVETAVLLDWNVKAGSIISRGETLCTLETTNGTIEVPSSVDGKIVQLFFEPGDEMPTGTALALIGEPGEALSDDVTTPGVSADPEQILRDELGRDESTRDKSTKYDLIVIGGGPAGYRAAARAAALGVHVALVEENLLGGTCVNYGCIPAKSLIHSARVYREARESTFLGVEGKQIEYSHSRALEWKNHTSQRMRAGIESQIRREGVTLIHGHGKISGPGRVRVDGAEYETNKILLACGAKATSPSLDTKKAKIPVLGSTAAFNMNKVPNRLLVIGGGYIGLEIAGLYHALGSEVTVMETASDILAFAGPEISRQMRLAMDGVRFVVNATPASVVGNTVKYLDEGTEQEFDVDCVVEVIGRKPRIDGLSEAGVSTGKLGVIVDNHMKTNLEGVYAAGDVTGKLMLAHAAYRMADIAVDSMFGTGRETLNMDTMPWVVYTMPELAGCGLTESQAADRGLDVHSNLLPLATNNRYFAEHSDPRGWCRIIAEKKNDRVIGTFMMGYGVSELIGQAAMAIESGMTLAQIARTVSPHPTMSEAFRDAADAAGHISKVMASEHLGNPHL